MVQQGSSTVIQAGSDRLAALAGINADSLTMNDFVLVGFTSFENRVVPTVIS